MRPTTASACRRAAIIVCCASRARIADLAGRDRIDRTDVAQAIAYRELHPMEAAAGAAA